MLTKNDLKQIEILVDRILEAKLKPLTVEIKELHRRVKKMERDLKLITNYFDREYLDHDKRITRIETHLGLQSN